MQSPSMRAFLLKWVPGLKKTPTRGDLSGPVLQRAFSDTRAATMKPYECGVYSSMQVDGYKSRAGNKVMGVLAVNVSRTSDKVDLDLRRAADITGVAETADLIFETIDGDIERCVADGLLARPGQEAESRSKLSVLVAVVSDSASFNVAAKRRLRVKYSTLFIVACYAHQLNLLSGNIITHTSMRAVTATASLVVALFSRSTKYMGMLQKLVIALLGKPLKFEKKGDTRWYSHHAMVRRILQLKVPLVQFGNDNFMDADLRHTSNGPAVLDALHSWQFWERLEVLRSLLKPIVVELGIIESRASNLADVSASSGRLYAFYSHTVDATATPVGSTSHDQAAVFSVAASPKTKTLTHQIAGSFLKYLQWRYNYYYDAAELKMAHVLDPDRHLRGLLATAGAYASPPLLLDYFLSLARRLSLPAVSAAASDREQNDMRTVQAMVVYLTQQGPSLVVGPLVGQANAGRNTAISRWAVCLDFGDTALPEVARRLLSTPAHAAELERVWSSMGLIGTNMRTRLTTTRLEMMKVVNMGLRASLAVDNPEKSVYQAGSARAAQEGPGGGAASSSGALGAASVASRAGEVAEGVGMGAAVDSPPAPDMGPGGALDGVSGAEEGEEAEEADGLVAVEEEVQQALLDEVREHGGPDSATDTSPAPVASRLTKDALLEMLADFAAGGTPGAGSSQQAGGEPVGVGQPGGQHPRKVLLRDVYDRVWYLAQTKSLYGEE